MENPVDFDIWCKVNEGTTKSVAEWTSKIHSIAVLEALKAVRESLAQDGYIQIYVGCGWHDLPMFCQELPDFVQKDTRVTTESTYRPSFCPRFCAVHLLKYVAQECPVCTGFYISHVVDGKRIRGELPV